MMTAPPMGITLAWAMVFFYGFALDLLQVLMTSAIVGGRAIRLANLSVVFSAMAAGAVVSVASDRRLFVPYLAGVWLGSLAGMRASRSPRLTPCPSVTAAPPQERTVPMSDQTPATTGGE